MLNKVVLRVFLSISLALSFFSAANAALITQNFISDNTGGVIGTITIDTALGEDAGNGLSEVFVWEEFSFYGFDILELAEPDITEFYASFDTIDFSLGIFDMAFDVNDSSGRFYVSGEVSGGTGEVNFFDTSGFLLDQFETFSLSDASVVPTPATLVLFLTAIVALTYRRRSRS